MKLYQVWFTVDGSTWILFATHTEFAVAYQRAKNIIGSCSKVVITHLICGEVK